MGRSSGLPLSAVSREAVKVTAWSCHGLNFRFIVVRAGQLNVGSAGRSEDVVVLGWWERRALLMSGFGTPTVVYVLCAK